MKQDQYEPKTGCRASRLVPFRPVGQEKYDEMITVPNRHGNNDSWHIPPTR